MARDPGNEVAWQPLCCQTSAVGLLLSSYFESFIHHLLFLLNTIFNFRFLLDVWTQLLKAVIFVYQERLLINQRFHLVVLKT